MNPEDFIAAARSMLGVKFRHQGRNPEFGVDCAGLAVCSAKICGIDVSDRHGYYHSPESLDFLEALRESCDDIQPGREQPGDLLIFDQAGRPQHLAILTQLDPAYMIHSSAPQRKVVEHLIDEEWMGLRKFIFRVRSTAPDGE